MTEKIYETYSPEETHALGKRLGAEAKPGDVYTLVGDLGVGKTVFTQGIAEGLGITGRSPARPLQSCRYMRRAGCRFIISMFTASGTSRRWMRSATRIISAGDGLCMIEWANLIDEISAERRSEVTIEKIWKWDLIIAELP